MKIIRKNKILAQAIKATFVVGVVGISATAEAGNLFVTGHARTTIQMQTI